MSSQASNNDAVQNLTVVRDMVVAMLRDKLRNHLDMYLRTVVLTEAEVQVIILLLESKDNDR